MRTQIYSGPELSRTGLSFGGVVDFGGNAGFPEDAALPIVKYLRIFSSGLAGGFFLASSELQNSRKHERRKKPITVRGCRAIADA